MEKHTKYIEGQLRDAFAAGYNYAQNNANGRFAITFDQWLLTNSGAVNNYEGLLTALQDCYMVMYAGNSRTLEDAMARSCKTDEFEQRLVRLLSKTLQ